MAPTAHDTTTPAPNGPGSLEVRRVEWDLDVRYAEKTFSGRVRISFDQAPDPLVIDSLRLDVEETRLDGAPVDLVVDPARATLTLEHPPPGPHVLEIRYRGAVQSDSLVGMYTAPAGTRYVLTTMLFPSGSRTLLPSFEHPAVKTVYQLVLTTEPDLHVVFNTPATGQRSVGGRTEWTFAPTPRMSAYLLYLGIGPFDTLTVPGGRWSATVAASPGRASAGRYAAERATEILAAYEEYYGVPYPLPKLDMIALENFWAGAMENWGAIAYRDDILLVDGTTSVRLRRRILSTLAHEIAHQWFGNLVTNAWWDDFWLNESFATFVGYAILHRRYPAEEVWKERLVRWTSPALEMDALTSTHPVHVPVVSADELGENADSVTYGKGAAVLRMVEAYLGEETFRRGISLYLTRHQYANARADDLWNALAEVANQPVGRILAPWITRPGYPLVRVRWANGELVLRQERFRTDGSRTDDLWPIPLRVRTSSGEQALLFDGRELRLPRPSPEGLRIDPDRPGFFRLLYEGALFDRMLESLPSMAPPDQWGFVTDLDAFVDAELEPFDRLLQLYRVAEQFTDDLPISEIVSSLGDLRVPASGVPKFESAARRFLRVQRERVGLEARPGESESQVVLRETLLASSVRFDPDFARHWAPRYQDFDRLPPALRGSAAVAFAKVGGAEAFEELVRRLRTTELGGERTQMLQALAELEDPATLRRAFDLIPSPGVTPSGAYVLLLSASTNPDAGPVLFDWLREKMSPLSEMWVGSPLLSEFLHGGMIGIGRDREAEVRGYFADHLPAEASAGARYGLEMLGLAMRLRRSLHAGPNGRP